MCACMCRFVCMSMCMYACVYAYMSISMCVRLFSFWLVCGACLSYGVGGEGLSSGHFHSGCTGLASRLDHNIRGVS